MLQEHGYFEAAFLAEDVGTKLDLVLDAILPHLRTVEPKSLPDDVAMIAVCAQDASRSVLNGTGVACQLTDPPKYGTYYLQIITLGGILYCPSSVRKEIEAVRAAKAVFRRYGGILRMADALRKGVHRRTLYAMRDAGQIEVLRAVFFVFPICRRWATRTW